MTKEIKTLVEAILEREEYGQLCPETIKKLKEIKKQKRKNTSFSVINREGENNEH